MASTPEEEKTSITNSILYFWPLVQSCEDPINKYFTKKKGLLTC